MTTAARDGEDLTGSRESGVDGGPEPLLAVEGLHVAYQVGGREVEAVHDVSFTVESGGVLGVVGESGCGKSTLSTALLRLLPPNGRITAGSVRLRGEELLDLDAGRLRQVRGRRIAMIFQDPQTSLNPTFDAASQLVAVQKAHRGRRADGDEQGGRVTEKELRRRAVDMLSRVGIPDADERIDDYPYEFSGGMRQRIMIAMALLLDPELLICDEATSALDVTLQAQILEQLGELCVERNTAMVFISHDLGVVSEICRRLLVLYAGRVVEQGEVQGVLADPRHPYTRRLLASVPSRERRRENLRSIPGQVPALDRLPPGCKFAGRCEFEQDVCTQDEPALLDADGRGVRCLAYDPESAFDRGQAQELLEPATPQQAETAPADDGQATVGSDDVLLNVEDLEMHFQARRSLLDRLAGRRPAPVRAVDGVDLILDRGETLGLVGESGCGKTTLGRSVLGLLEPTGGRITFDGTDLRSVDRHEWRALRRRMQMIFQEPAGSLSPRLRVSQLLTEPYRIHGVPPGQRIPVEELLARVELSPDQAGKYPHELSGGQARRVGVARALAMEPDLLVADEPTAGLDVSAAARVLNLLGDLQDRLGLSYVIITHDLNLVGYIADTVAVMYLGEVIEYGPADRIFDAPAHPYTQGLLAAVPHPDPEGGSVEHGALPTGEIPSPQNPPSGCRFRTRCPYARERCAEEVPELRDVEGAHTAACHFFEEIGEQLGTAP